jgi:exopolyphosphatase/guanosine-5'-triphosphate,3'-diphosphate pyrophosphatase
MQTEIIKLFKSEEKTKTKQAIIDLGSNSIRMLIYDDFKLNPIPLFNEKAVCKLGKNLDKSKKLNADGCVSALKVLNRFKEILEVSEVRNLQIVATAALREADDAKSFLDKVEEIFNTEPRVLTGEEEAETAANGVILGFGNIDGVVADLGGGSLELTRVSNNIIHEKISLPLGVLRLMNNPIIKKKNLPKYIRNMLKDYKWLIEKKLKNLYVVGGTWRALLKNHIYQDDYPLHVLHQYRLNRYSAVKYLNKISNLNKSSLKSLEPITKSRTQFLPYSSIILNELIEIVDPKYIICSISGLREGHMDFIYNKDKTKIDILNSHIDTIVFQKGDFGKSYLKYFNFIKPAFDGNEIFNDKLLNLSCILSKMDWGLGAFQKAGLVFNEVLNTPILQLSHQERVMIALASFWRHCSLKYNPNYKYLGLLTNNQIINSKRVGAALRLSESLTSLSSLLLDEFKIYKRRQTLYLKIPRVHMDIVSKQVTKKFKALAKIMELESSIIYSQ